jgi:hypothetical protein
MLFLLFMIYLICLRYLPTGNGVVKKRCGVWVFKFGPQIELRVKELSDSEESDSLAI